MGFRDSGSVNHKETQPRVSDELLAVLRQRVEARYYDQPHVIELIARAILISRGIYPH